MKKSQSKKSKRSSFTIENVVRSFSEVTGLDPSRLSVDGKLTSSARFCELLVNGPVVGDQNFYDVTVYRDQAALDECSAYDLEYDEYGDGLVNVGILSTEDVVRYASKGCRLSDLKHWIISEGRQAGLDEARIATQLRRPLETLVEHYRPYEMEGAFSTLVSQCLSDERSMAKHLIKAAGGAQKIWTDELYHVLPGGFIAHFISSADQTLFRQLLAARSLSTQ
jgi:hypothetical protein